MVSGGSGYGGYINGPRVYGSVSRVQLGWPAFWKPNLLLRYLRIFIVCSGQMAFSLLSFDDLPSRMAVLSYAAATLFTYTIAVYVYRIYFSPLSHIPGPRLAAATSLYEFYYDAVKEGRYWARIAEMHQKYGKVVPFTSSHTEKHTH